MVAGDVQSHTDLVGFYLNAGAPEKLEVKFDGEMVPWESGTREMTLPPGAMILQDESDESEGEQDVPETDADEDNSEESEESG